MILGLTGTNASGKTSIVRYFLSKGYEYHSLSDIIRDELTMRGMLHSRDNLRHVGNELRREHGPSILAEKVIQKIKTDNVIIDSIRNIQEVATLRALKNFKLIAVDAPIETRFARSKRRRRLENATDLNTFKKLEDKEKSSEQTSQNIHQCMKLADFTIFNDGTLADLFRKVDKIIEQITKR